MLAFTKSEVEVGLQLLQVKIQIEFYEPLSQSEFYSHLFSVASRCLEHSKLLW